MERRHRDISVAGWKREHAALERRVDAASHFTGFTEADAPGLTLSLHRDEHVFMVIDHVELVEPGPDSVEASPILDTGIATITDHRVVFEGRRRSREWSFSKLVDARHHDRPPSTSIEVENRQRVSGIVYDVERAPDVRFLLDLALAIHAGKLADFRAGLEREFAQHTARRPGVHAGAWVWRGWTRPIPAAITVGALILAGALVYATSGGDNTLRAHRGATSPPTTSLLPVEPSPTPQPPSPPVPAAAPVATVVAAPARRAPSAGTAPPQAETPAPAGSACATTAALGPVAVPDPVCTVNGAL